MQDAQDDEIAEDPINLFHYEYGRVVNYSEMKNFTILDPGYSIDIESMEYDTKPETSIFMEKSAGTNTDHSDTYKHHLTDINDMCQTNSNCVKTSKKCSSDDLTNIQTRITENSFTNENVIHKYDKKERETITEKKILMVKHSDHQTEKETNKDYTHIYEDKGFKDQTITKNNVIAVDRVKKEHGVSYVRLIKPKKRCYDISSDSNVDIYNRINAKSHQHLNKNKLLPTVFTKENFNNVTGMSEVPKLIPKEIQSNTNNLYIKSITQPTNKRLKDNFKNNCVNTPSHYQDQNVSLNIKQVTTSAKVCVKNILDNSRLLQENAKNKNLSMHASNLRDKAIRRKCHFVPRSNDRKSDDYNAEELNNIKNNSQSSLRIVDPNYEVSPVHKKRRISFSESDAVKHTAAELKQILPHGVLKSETTKINKHFVRKEVSKTNNMIRPISQINDNLKVNNKRVVLPVPSPKHDSLHNSNINHISSIRVDKDTYKNIPTILYKAVQPIQKNYNHLVSVFPIKSIVSNRCLQDCNIHLQRHCVIDKQPSFPHGYRILKRPQVHCVTKVPLASIAPSLHLKSPLVNSFSSNISEHNYNKQPKVTNNTIGSYNKFTSVHEKHIDSNIASTQYINKISIKTPVLKQDYFIANNSVRRDYNYKKYPKLVSALEKSPLNNACLSNNICKSTFVDNGTNVKQNKIAESSHQKEYSPPILPIMSYETILNFIDSKEHYDCSSYYYTIFSSCSINKKALSRKYGDRQNNLSDLDDIKTKINDTDMKNAKKISLCEYKRRLSFNNK